MHGADPNIVVDPVPVLGNIDTPIAAATRNGHIEVVKALIEEGADINFMHPLGFAALHEAIVNSNLDIFYLLVDNGADIHRRGSFYQVSPLWLARQTGLSHSSSANSSIQKYLKQKGGVISVSGWGMTIMAIWCAWLFTTLR